MGLPVFWAANKCWADEFWIGVQKSIRDFFKDFFNNIVGELEKKPKMDWNFEEYLRREINFGAFRRRGFRHHEILCHKNLAETEISEIVRQCNNSVGDREGRKIKEKNIVQSEQEKSLIHRFGAVSWQLWSVTHV